MRKIERYCWEADRRREIGIASLTHSSPTKVANGLAQTHWVDIALGLPVVPEQTESQRWLRGSLASWKHDIIFLAPLMRRPRNDRKEGKARLFWQIPWKCLLGKSSGQADVFLTVFLHACLCSLFERAGKQVEHKPFFFLWKLDIYMRAVSHLFLTMWCQGFMVMEKGLKLRSHHAWQRTLELPLPTKNSSKHE